MIQRLFGRLILSRGWLSFVVLCLSFATFGAGTLNLFNMLSQNVALIAAHGWMALMDGAAQQLLELLITLAFSMGAYIVFKACEHRLVDRLSHPSEE